MVALSLGLSRMLEFCVFALLFYAGGEIIIRSVDENGKPTVLPGDVFMALFVIMFGAIAAGNASGWGPDMGKAKAASKRIFTFIEHPSKINAIAQDSDTN